MKLSLLDLRSPAFSTNSRILVAVDSPNSLVTRMRSTPDRFTQPENTPSSSSTSRGWLSPVSATVSSADCPSIIIPSIGIRSPGSTTIISPTATSSGITRTISPSRSTLAKSGRMSIRPEIARRLLSSAISSNNSPIWNSIITSTASINSGSAPGRKPITRAPTVAMHMRNSSPKTSPWNIPSTASISTS